MHRWLVSKENCIQNCHKCAAMTVPVRQSHKKHGHRDDGCMTQIQRAHNIQISSDTHINTHWSMHVCTCMFHQKWVSPRPNWQLRSQFDVNSCRLSSAWSAYSTSSVILSMALWQGQLPWGKALATTPCNKAPQGIHQAKRPPKSAELFAKMDKTLYN